METITAADFRRQMSKGSVKIPNRANDLTKAILTYLNRNGYEARRINTVGVFDPDFASKKLIGLCHSFAIAKRKPTIKEIRAILTNCFRTNTGQIGVSDIIGWQKGTGRFIAVEVKAGRDKLSVEQRYYLQSVIEGGGIGIEARSVEGFVEELRRQGG